MRHIERKTARQSGNPARRAGKPRAGIPRRRLRCERLEERRLLALGEMLHPLIQPDPAPVDCFGESVAISGNKVVVGAPLDDAGAFNAGSAYIFDAVTGRLLHTLVNPTPRVEDLFGYSVAISGDTVVVGAFGDVSDGSRGGSAYVFDAATGQLRHTLHNPTPDASDRFGWSVAISGDTVVVGDVYDDAPDENIQAGGAYLFSAATGAFLRPLPNPTPAGSDWFGYSVAISGDTVVVGGDWNRNGPNDVGLVYVFDASTGRVRTSLANPNPHEDRWFTISVAVSGNHAVVGAEWDETVGTMSGRAFVFDATTGALLHTLASPSPALGDSFGHSVAISGNTVVVGAKGDDFASGNVGAAYVFDAATGNRLATLNNPNPAPSSAFFGDSVAVSGPLAVVSSQYGDVVLQRGGAYLFDVTTGPVPPDLRMRSVTAHAADRLSLTYEVIGGPVGAFEIGIYRSPGQLLDTVRIDQAADLATGIHTKIYAIGTAPGQIALPGVPGCAETSDDYTLFARADPLARIAEANESNNTVDLTGIYLAGGQVFVHGAATADTITMAVWSTTINVTLNAMARGFAAAEVSGLRVRAHGGDDTVTGSALAKPIRMWGGPGDDVLGGGTGGDIYFFDCDAPQGRDEIADAGGVDTLDFAATTGRAIMVNLSLTTDQVVNDRLTLHLLSGSSIENLRGGALNDTLTGNDLPNRLEGRGGRDMLKGRGGNDRYLFDCDTALGSDTIDESPTAGGGGADTLDFSSTTTQAVILYLARLGTVQVVNPNLTLTLVAGTAIESAVGGAKDDLLVGNSRANVLVGGAGNNILLGAGGNDMLYGGPGRDLLIGGSGRDQLHGAGGDDLLIGGTTSYCNETTGTIHRTALNAILLEWKSTNSLSVRVGHLRTGGGLNGAYKLSSSTVGNDSAVDALFGEDNDDWAVAGAGDSWSGVESVTTI